MVLSALRPIRISVEREVPRELPEGSPFAPREVIAGKDARTLAREILAMSQEEFTAAFRRSPMKRAKLRGLKRNAAVVLGNVRSAENTSALAALRLVCVTLVAVAASAVSSPGLGAGTSLVAQRLRRLHGEPAPRGAERS